MSWGCRVREGGGEQVIAGAVGDEAERCHQQAGLDIVAHLAVGADGDSQPGDCRLQAEIEVLEGLTRHLLVGGHACVLLPLQPGARTGLGVQTGPLA